LAFVTVKASRYLLLLTDFNNREVKVKVKIKYPTAGHEDPEVE